MFGALAASAGINAIGSIIGAKGAEDAAEIQAGAANTATGEQRRQFDISRADSAPYRAAGSAAVSRLSNLLGLDIPGASRSSGDLVIMAGGVPTLNPKYENDPAAVKAWNEVLSLHNTGLGASGYSTASDPAWIANQLAQRLPATSGTERPGDFGSLNRRFTLEDFEADPVNKLSMQFGMDEGTKAIRRMFGAQGMGRSGAAAKGLTKFATDYAGSKAAESRGRFIQDQDITFNRLSGVSGTGQTSTAHTASLGANMATNIGNNITGAANARGAAAIAGANAYAAPISQVGNIMSTKYLLDGMRPQAPSQRYSFDDMPLDYGLR